MAHLAFWAIQLQYDDHRAPLWHCQRDLDGQWLMRRRTCAEAESKLRHVTQPNEQRSVLTIELIKQHRDRTCKHATSAGLQRWR